MDIQLIRDSLREFKFKQLFIEGLGWNNPKAGGSTSEILDGVSYEFKMISILADVPVFEVVSSDEGIPSDKAVRRKLHKLIQRLYHEHLLIFIDRDRKASLWFWVKYADGKEIDREHPFMMGQTGELFLSKLVQLYVDFGELDGKGNLEVSAALTKLRSALDQEPTTKKFFADFQKQHLAFIEFIKGIDDERDRRWYASIILNRMMFIYFLQGKGFLDKGDRQYLQHKLDLSKKQGKNLFFAWFLEKLFFEGFAKPEDDRAADTNAVLGSIKYLNGGLFLKHRIEQENPKIEISDKAFENLLALFTRYTWNLDDVPGGKDDELNPDVLGYIFEKYINQKAFGAYYTRTEITEYLCEHTIRDFILDKVHSSGLTDKRFTSIGELLVQLDEKLCRHLYYTVLPELKILDPACGSGAFLVAAMKTLIQIYQAIFGKAHFLKDTSLRLEIQNIQTEHSAAYFIKRKIITDNLFGVDLMEEATEIAKLRLFLNLVQSAETIEQLEPLPNIDFNILAGNSLIGLLRVGDDRDLEKSKSNLWLGAFDDAVQKKNKLVEQYRHFSATKKSPDAGSADLTVLRDEIANLRNKAATDLNRTLLEDFNGKGIKFEQATWDEASGKEGRPQKRALRESDIEALHPFHWGYEFNEIMEKGGFDVIITNPPWDILKPNAKEFFLEHSSVVSKNKMTIKEFEKEQAKLLKKAEIREPWLEYESRFPHQSAYFRSAKQYENQISVVNGKKQGTDINLYKLFTEQAFNLLKSGGRTGIVIPSGIYTDLGAKQLREMLFSESTITGIFGFENRKTVFEGVDSRFKFVVLTFRKEGETHEFPVAFMRHDVEDLASFPGSEDLRVSVELIRSLSPDSLSIMEFKSKVEIQIAQKLLTFPMLGEKIEGSWNVKLSREFDMTNDSYLFKTRPGVNRLPLWEGKMFWQFNSFYAEPKYWLEEKEARKALLGGVKDAGEVLPYQRYRLAFRDVASNTNERTVIATVLPPDRFCGNTAIVEDVANSVLSHAERFTLVAFLDSFVLDAALRSRVTSHVSFYIAYSAAVPRLTQAVQSFWPIALRSLRLICTDEAFARAWNEVIRECPEEERMSLKPKWSKGSAATDEAERARLRAEIDGMVARIYGVTEEEFAHILSTFPLVDQSVKDAAMAEFIKLQPSDETTALRKLIDRGEGLQLEFKETLRWDAREAKVHPGVEKAVLKTIAAFINTKGGELLIGVDDNGNAVGLAPDFATFGKRHNDRDEFEQHFHNLIHSKLGKESSALIEARFATLDGQEIYQVTVKPSKKEAFLMEDGKEIFYIRSGNTTQQLTPREMLDYVKHRT